MKPQAYIVVDLGFGDSGKGTMVDHLAAITGARLVVRFSGGPNCSHAVVMPDGRFHRFSQFGSGTFVPGVRTHLAGGVLIEPYALLNEADALANTLPMHPMSLFCQISVDPSCAVITPYHWRVNRGREIARGRRRHGSCGIGLGELRAWREKGCPELTFRDFGDRSKTRRILDAIRQFAFQEAEEINFSSDILREDNGLLTDFYYHFRTLIHAMDADELRDIVRTQTTIFEGNQGVLLDEEFGFWPYNTWSKTTAEPAQKITDDAGVETRTIGVLRTFLTRHGPGPFVSENPNLVALANDDHNKTNEWQGELRTGYFDAVMARYALDCCPVDEIALTHLDKVRSRSRFVASYLMPGFNPVHEVPVPCTAATLREARPLLSDRDLSAREWVDALPYIVECPVKHISWGQTRNEKKSFDIGGAELPAELQLRC